MASNQKKINIPISSSSSDEIYPLDDIINDYEEKIGNIMNDPDAEFEYRTAIGDSGSDISEALIRKEDDSNGRNFIPTTKPIETVVKIAKPDSESENDGNNVPLSYLVAKKRFCLEME